MTLTDKQRGVRKGIVGGMILTLAGLAAGIAFIPTSLTPDSPLADRLTYSLKADILVIFWLMHCIGRLGRHHFHTPEDIDGGGPSRALGFALTFYSSALMFVVATVTAAWQLMA